MLRELTGKREEKIAIEDEANLEELIVKISHLNGRKFQDYVFQNNRRLKRGFAYAVDGETLGSKDLRALKCANVKEFAILPPISGGVYNSETKKARAKKYRMG